jgi:hypothetical protein
MVVRFGLFFLGLVLGAGVGIWGTRFDPSSSESRHPCIRLRLSDTESCSSKLKDKTVGVLGWWSDSDCCFWALELKAVAMASIFL